MKMTYNTLEELMSSRGNSDLKSHVSSVQEYFLKK